jgi:hypothetical protein
MERALAETESALERAAAGARWLEIIAQKIEIMRQTAELATLRSEEIVGALLGMKFEKARSDIRQILNNTALLAGDPVPARTAPAAPPGADHSAPPLASDPDDAHAWMALLTSGASRLNLENPAVTRDHLAGALAFVTSRHAQWQAAHDELSRRVSVLRDQCAILAATRCGIHDTLLIDSVLGYLHQVRNPFRAVAPNRPGEPV